MIFLNSQHVVIDFPGKKMRSAVEYEKKSQHHEQDHDAKHGSQISPVAGLCGEELFLWHVQNYPSLIAVSEILQYWSQYTTSYRKGRMIFFRK